MDSHRSPTHTLTFDEALSNAVRLAVLAEEAGSEPERRLATAQLSTAWGTIAQALASKYAAPAV